MITTNISHCDAGIFTSAENSSHQTSILAESIFAAYWGGKRTGSKRGRGAQGKTPFVTALQRSSIGYPLFICFSRVGGFTAEEMMQWGKKHLSAKSLVVSDGLACFRSLRKIGHFHFSVKTTERYDSPDFIFFDWLNTIIGNIRNALIRTYHGTEHWHLSLATSANFALDLAAASTS